MQAYTLTFRKATKPSDDAVEVGWVGTDGPGLPDGTWPRGPLTRLPMMHAFTIRVPEEYQTQGPEYPALAFFQGEGQFAEEAELDADDPFAKDVAAATQHPMLNLREDLIGGQFALVWLTEGEFTAGPTPPPADTRGEGDDYEDDEGPNAWDNPVKHGPVWMTPRADPNAGTVPGGGDYEDPFDKATRGWKAWAEPLILAEGHLGGTMFVVQAMPEGFTPRYLEVAEFGELNFGGGVCQIDLESDAFDWACG